MKQQPTRLAGRYGQHEVRNASDRRTALLIEILNSRVAWLLGVAVLAWAFELDPQELWTLLRELVHSTGAW